MKKQTVYLDHAASTPVNGAVLKSMQPFFTDKFYNPSALYLSARTAHKELEATREQVARTIGVRPAEVIFTSGASEANNLAIKGLLDQFPGAEIIVSAIEHDSVWAPAGRYKRVVAKVNTKGMIDVKALTGAITDKTVLVSIMYANNEVGTIQPLKEIAVELNKIRKHRQKRGIKMPLLFHTDASQAGNYLDIQAGRLGVDLMTINGGKIYGPKQSGCLYVKAGTKLLPLIDGGGQEWGIRSGTESLAQATGFANALTRVQTNRKAESKRVAELRDKLWSEIEAMGVGAERSGDIRSQLPNFLHVRFPGQDNERLVMELDESSIMAATGSACKASSDEPSRTLLAMGMRPDEAAETVRFSLGELTQPPDIDYTVKVLKTILK